PQTIAKSAVLTETLKLGGALRAHVLASTVTTASARRESDARSTNEVVAAPVAASPPPVAKAAPAAPPPAAPPPAEAGRAPARRPAPTPAPAPPADKPSAPAKPAIFGKDVARKSRGMKKSDPADAVEKKEAAPEDAESLRVPSK